MAKKFSLLMAAIAIVAFAVPTFASANAKVTDPANVLLAPGKLIEATNVGNVTTQTSLGVLTCPTVTVTGELTANTGTTYKGIGIGQGTSSACTVGGKPLTITDITLIELHSGTTLAGTINVKFVGDLPGGVVCTFSSPNMPYAVTGTDTIKITNGDLAASPPACEPGLLTGTFTLETDNTFTQIHLD
jgi:hypothetical protein